MSITAIISTADNGKSTGIIRESYAVPALGDIRKNISALTPEADWLEYRFSGGFLDGHPTGNIWLLGLIKVYGMAGGINKAQELLNVSPHRVIPATAETHDLIALLENNEEIHGEWDIDKIVGPIQKLSLSIPVQATKEAMKALSQADMILVGPGTFYTSILSCFLIDEIADAFRLSKAKKVYIANLCNHPREQYQNYTLQKYLDEFERHIGHIQFDTILAHKNGNQEDGIVIDVTDPRIFIDDFADANNHQIHDVQKVLEWINKNI